MSACVTFHGSETRMAWPASATEAHRGQHMAGRDLAGTAGRPGADRDVLQIERDHLRIRPHARAAPGRWYSAAAAPAPQTIAPACTAAVSSRVAQRRVEPGHRRAPAAAAAAKPAMARQRWRAAAAAALLTAAGDQRCHAAHPAPAAARRPRRAAQLVRRQRQAVRPERRKIDGMRPAACTASTCSSAPCRRHTDAASATGCSTPVSLLASIRQTSDGTPSLSSASRASRSATPSAPTGTRRPPPQPPAPRHARSHL